MKVWLPLWDKIIYSSFAKFRYARMILSLKLENADKTGRLLAGSFTFECRVMHFILCHVLLHRSTNLSQASEKDLILLWSSWVWWLHNCLQKAFIYFYLFCIKINLRFIPSCSADYEMLLALDEGNHQHTGASANLINSLPQSTIQVKFTGV